MISEKVRRLAGDQVTLMGNIPPRDVLGAGTPEDVRQSVVDQMALLGDGRRTIVSAGGFTPGGFDAAKIEAFCRAAERAESWRELRAEAGSREQGAGSRERGAGSRERGAGGAGSEGGAECPHVAAANARAECIPCAAPVIAANAEIRCRGWVSRRCR